jgi:hypothetical protein
MLLQSGLYGNLDLDRYEPGAVAGPEDKKEPIKYIGKERL